MPAFILAISFPCEISEYSSVLQQRALWIFLYYLVTQLMSTSTLPKLPDDELASISNEGLQYILNNFDPQVPQRNFLWTADYKVELPVRVKKSGPGSEKPYTIAEMWKESLEKYSDLAALNYEAKPNQWVTVNYRQYYNESLKFAKSLIALGISEYSAINIIGFNSPEWAYAFHGAIIGHYLPIGMYTTNGTEACEYIANHSGAEAVILEDTTHLAKYYSILDKIPKVKLFVIWKGTVPTDLPQKLKGKVLTWAQFMAYSANFKPTSEKDTIQYRQAAQKPGNCATFIYTSGTTGPPKAVMISHDNYTWVTDAIASKIGLASPDRYGKNRVLSLLPLSHVAAQLLDLIVALRFGCSLYFSDPSALQGNLVKFLQIARPTFFLSVPRVWEKIEERITAIGQQTTGLKRKIADWAKSIAAQGTYAEINGGELPRGWGLAKKLVFNKIKENLGLDQCQYFYFSAAPMRESTRLFFLNLNIYLRNIFGMSELSGPETITNPAVFKDFSLIESLKEAGQVIEGLQIAIDNPDAEGNGEICLRGRNTFMGYYKNEKETRETVDKRGFVHSGDVGVVSSNGVLSITGRIKELIITAGGENVAPVLIENEINTALPLFSQSVVVGDKRKFLGVLLVLKTKSPGVLADEVVSYIKPRGSNATTVAEAVKCEALRKIVQGGIDAANKKAISKAQNVQKFGFLLNEFSVDGGELTPTLKLKRKIINQKYEAQINALYQEAKL